MKCQYINLYVCVYLRVFACLSVFVCLFVDCVIEFVLHSVYFINKSIKSNISFCVMFARLRLSIRHSRYSHKVTVNIKHNIQI